MFQRNFNQRIDGEDYAVVLIDSSADAPGDGREEVCEGCGREVNVFITTDLTATDPDQPAVSECLPCFFRGDWEKVAPR